MCELKDDHWTGAPTRETPAAPQDALQLLRADHLRIELLLDECDRLAARGGSSFERGGLLARLGALLLAHARIEDELFYPVLAAAPMAVDDARTDHDHIESQFKRLNLGELSAAEFGESVALLARLVREHVAEEERHLFTQVLQPEMHALGIRMALRRAELLGEQGAD